MAPPLIEVANILLTLKERKAELAWGAIQVPRLQLQQPTHEVKCFHWSSPWAVQSARSGTRRRCSTGAAGWTNRRWTSIQRRLRATCSDVACHRPNWTTDTHTQSHILTTGHYLYTTQTATENVSVWYLTDHSTSVTVCSYLLTYLLADTASLQSTVWKSSSLNWLIEEGLTSQRTHYTSYQGRVLMGHMTQPTVSKQWRKSSSLKWLIMCQVGR